MAGEELAAFRERWKRELTSKTEGPVCAPSHSGNSSGQRDSSKNSYFEDSKQNLNEACSPSKPEEGAHTGDEACVAGGGEGGEAAADSQDQPEYVSIAHSLLDGRTSPLLERIQEERTRRKRQYNSMTSACSASLQQHPQRKVKKDVKLLDQLIHDLVRGRRDNKNEG